MRDTRFEKKAKRRARYNPWTVVLSNFKHQEAGKRAFTYSQCDPVKQWNSGAHLVFASLYPMEKGFFGGNSNSKSLIKKAVNEVAEMKPEDFVEGEIGNTFSDLSQEVTGGDTTLKDYFQAVLMKMPIRRINYFQSAAYDYYEELKREYDFLVSKSAEETRNFILIPFIKNIFANKKKKRRKHPKSLEATGTYVVAKTANDIQQTLDASKMSFVLTVEGMHALGTDNNLDKVLDRIKEMKGWEYPVFFVTFAHHFDNGLCGHAHSIIKSASLLTDQSQAMNGPFNDLGRQAARLLLSLTDDNTRDDTLGRRILLDLKHTSATSRKQYYEEIIKPCMQKGDVIPVIASHVAYSGVKSLADFEANYDNETDDWEIDGFNAWNINVCDEDVEMIVNTGGLLGLCFDQRILGQQKHDNPDSKLLLWATLKGILDAVVNATSIAAADKPKVWQILTIGTDFEGYIDPTNKYATSLDFDKFRNDLADSIQTEIIDKGLSDKYFLTGNNDKDEVVEGICFANALQFVKNNF